MECHRPDGLGVISKCMGATSVYEVPYFHSAITTACGKVSSTWMECYSANPVLMAFPRHDEVSIWNRPYLPGVIIADCCHYRFFRMKRDTRDCELMTSKGLRVNPSDQIIWLRYLYTKVWIWTLIRWPFWVSSLKLHLLRCSCQWIKLRFFCRWSHGRHRRLGRLETPGT